MALKYEEMIKAKKFRPLQMGYLTEDFIEKSKKELNETDETRVKGIADLKKLILAEKKFKCPMDDNYLLQYLRARKFDLKRSYNLLQTFYQVKKDYSECFSEVDMDKLESLAKSGAATFLPYRSPDGCAVVLLEFSKWDCIEYGIVEAMRMLAIVLLYAAEDPATQVCGIRAIVNARGCTLRQIKCISPRYIILLSKALRNCIPTRFKGIHIYNESAIFHIIWSLLKVFLTEKINSRVHFHGDNQKQLHKFFPKEILTEEYGGMNSYFNQGEWNVKMLHDFKPRMDELLGSGVRE